MSLRGHMHREELSSSPAQFLKVLRLFCIDCRVKFSSGENRHIFGLKLLKSRRQGNEDRATDILFDSIFKLCAFSWIFVGTAEFISDSIIHSEEAFIRIDSLTSRTLKRDNALIGLVIETIDKPARLFCSRIIDAVTILKKMYQGFVADISRDRGIGDDSRFNAALEGFLHMTL